MYNKLKTTILAFVIAITSAMAQAPNMINYQGAAHNANGTAIANQAIKLRLSIHTATAAGTVQYSEVRNATTDASGLFNVQIGATGAVSTTGSWGAINWKSGAKYLQVEMDPTGGTAYINMGTQQLVSVPYAQHAKEAGSLIPTATINPSQIANGGAAVNQVLKFNGTNWVPGNISGGSSFNMPYTETDSTYIAMLDITNKLGTGLKATSITGSAILGESNGNGNGLTGTANAAAGIGVLGSSNSGTGLKGYSNSNTGVFGSTLTGTAVKAFSYQGYGLDVNGKVKIAGGNTNPGYGKVLTSDNFGNATWQSLATTPKVAFKANYSSTSFPDNTAQKVLFINEAYDKGYNFNILTSTFTAPVGGVYNFCAATELSLSSSIYNMVSPRIAICVKRNGVETIESQTTSIVDVQLSYCTAFLKINCDVNLLPGDEVFVRVRQYNGQGITAVTNYMATEINYFCGHLVLAD